jgi:hypothetical protein
VATLAGPGMASPGRRMAQWLRVVVLGPRGGGVSRRRAFDAFRLGFGSGSIWPRYAPVASTGFHRHLLLSPQIAFGWS